MDEARSSNANHDAPAPQVQVVRADDLDSDTPQTANMQRFEAISAKRLGAQELWMGMSVIPPGVRTGIHHHGDSETALYILSGVGRWWVGDNLDDGIEARPGDFVFVPPRVVHWEENASTTEPVRMIVARSTQDAIVVNLDETP